MTCHWQDKWIRFQKQGKGVTLQGLTSKAEQQLQEISVEQVEKSVKGNDIWATAVVSFATETTSVELPQII